MNFATRPRARLLLGLRNDAVESCGRRRREITARTERHEEAAGGEIRPRRMARIEGPLFEGQP